MCAREVSNANIYIYISRDIVILMMRAPVFFPSFVVFHAEQCCSPCCSRIQCVQPKSTLLRSRAMVASTDRVRAWFELAKSCMSDSDWKVAATIPNASLSHREWGEQGIRLIRFDLRNVFVKDAPEKPCELFVRRVFGLKP